MERLTPELARILTNRIAKALKKARYFPAMSSDEMKAAEEVVKPFLPLAKVVEPSTTSGKSLIKKGLFVEPSTGNVEVSSYLAMGGESSKEENVSR